MVVMLRVVSVLPWCLLLFALAGAAGAPPMLGLGLGLSAIALLLLLRRSPRKEVGVATAAPPCDSPVLTARAVPDEMYVDAECCTGCGVPPLVAPELFAEGERGCVVRRQPASAVELRQALRVFRTQDLGCVRYRGRNPRVLAALTQIGCRAHCDQGSKAREVLASGPIERAGRSERAAGLTAVDLVSHASRPRARA